MDFKYFGVFEIIYRFFGLCCIFVVCGFFVCVFPPSTFLVVVLIFPADLPIKVIFKHFTSETANSKNLGLQFI